MKSLVNKDRVFDRYKLIKLLAPLKCGLTLCPKFGNGFLIYASTAFVKHAACLLHGHHLSMSCIATDKLKNFTDRGC